MLIWIAALGVACLVALASTSTLAFDIFALKVLGFSPDGRYFAFMHYGPQVDAGKLFAETFVIDTNTDRYVPGAPARLSAEMKDDAESIEAEVKAFLDRATRRTAGLVNQHRISRPGVVLASAPDVRVNEYEHTPERPPPGAGATELTARHPQLGELKLKLELKEMDWPRTSRLYAGKEAPSCSEAVDGPKGAAFRLTLDRAGRTVVLQDDKTIPASRHCVTTYGIAQVLAFDRPDGKVTLTVIIGMRPRGFEGEDRTFMAVTRVLDR